MVKDLKEFELAFAGLKSGKHQFNFEAGKTFFDAFESSDIHDGGVKISVEMDKQERMMVCTFKIKGNLKLECDRCLAALDFPLDFNETLIIKYSREDDMDDSDILTIAEHESSINLAPFLYESIALMVPFRKVHPENEFGESSCDTAQIEKIEQMKGVEDIDPRWAALQKLKKKTEE